MLISIIDHYAPIMKSIQNDASAGRKQLRHRKKERSKEEILAVAEKLYSEKPIDQVLLEDVAEAALVSRTTIYNYFENKNDVLFAVSNRVFKELNEKTAATLPKELSGKEQVLFLCAKTLKDGSENPIILKILRDTFNHIRNMNLTPESITESIVNKIGQSTLNGLVEDSIPSNDFNFEKHFEEPHFIEFYVQLLRYGRIWVKAIKKGKKDRTIKSELEDVPIVLYVTMLINGLLAEMELRRIDSKVMGIEEEVVTDATLNLIALFLENNVSSLGNVRSESRSRR
jgi:AcrR family transcriptional regulator